MAALFGGGALGIVPALATGDWKSGQTWIQLWLCVSLGVAAVAALGFSETARRSRDRMLGRNGTAYIIQEQARFWADDKAERFREGIRRQFARVVQVPGPVELSRGWDWPLDADARHWDGKVGELVRAFRVLSIDETRDGTATPNGVFMWAWWAVAMAFGMRATAADRSLVLDVWQRPSNARMGEVAPGTWAQRPNRFGSAALPASLSVSEHVWPVELTVSRRGRARPSGASQADIHELRCVPPGSEFAWQDFPALAAEAAAWIERKTKGIETGRSSATRPRCGRVETPARP